MTNDEAEDEILATFLTAWTAAGAAATPPTTYPVDYEDVPLGAAMKVAIDSGSVPWARVRIKPNKRFQATLAGTLGRRFDEHGILFIELYTPSGDGLTLARFLSTLVRNAFEGVSTPNGVWFRDVVATRVGPDGHWFHYNVTASYQFDEVR